MANSRFNFRAWDKKENKMYAPIHEAYKGNLWELMVGFKGDLLAHSMDGVIHESMFPDRYIIMQFTGLHDKNGKKIFEGDFVKWGHLNLHSAENPIRIAVVKIDPDIQFEIIDRPHYQLCFLEKHHIFHFGSFAYANTTERDLEIIGNIYETPELL